jgi:ankyrin repeat protein
MAKVIEAVKALDKRALAKLLSAGESPDAVDETTGESALAIAAWKGDVGCVQLLLEYDADPNACGTPASPLSNAAGEGHTQVVELLLDADADVDATDEDAGTPLIDATAGGYFEIVQLLVEAGADVRKTDDNNRQAIDYALEKGHKPILNFLMPLVSAAKRKLIQSAFGGASSPANSESILKLLDAVNRGDVEAARVILSRGANVNTILPDGVSVTFAAAAHGHCGILELLVEHGADINHQTPEGRCALDYAAIAGQSLSFDYLLPLTNRSLCSAAEALRKTKISRGEWILPRPDIDEQFQHQKIDDKALRDTFTWAQYASSAEAEAEFYKCLDELEVPANAIQSDGTTLLMTASRSGNLNCVKKLVEHYHLDPNATNKCNTFALSAAHKSRSIYPAEAQAICEYLSPLTNPKLRDSINL